MCDSLNDYGLLWVLQGRVLASCHRDFLQGVKSARFFVPRMSPFMLRVLLTMPKNAGFPHVVSGEVDPILHALFRLGSVKMWPTFEAFHALFECLRHTLLSTLMKQESESVEKLYPGALVGDKFSSGPLVMGRRIRLRPRSMMTLESHLKLTQVHCAEHLGHVVLAGPGNPGFDIAVPIEKDEYVLIEARFSQPDVNTYVDIEADIVAKRKLILENIGDFSGMCSHVVFLRRGFAGLEVFQNSGFFPFSPLLVCIIKVLHQIGGIGFPLVEFCLRKCYGFWR